MTTGQDLQEKNAASKEGDQQKADKRTEVGLENIIHPKDHLNEVYMYPDIHTYDYVCNPLLMFLADHCASNPCSEQRGSWACVNMPDGHACRCTGQVVGGVCQDITNGTSFKRALYLLNMIM